MGPPTPPADATPLVFVHGLLGSATNFRAIQSRAARGGRRTLAVDLRNHGASPHSPGPTSLRELALDVAAAVEARLGGAGAADFVGHSLGGKTAMALALLRPRLVRRAAVVDIAPVAYAAEGAQAHGAWRDVAAVVRAAHALDASRFRVRGEVDAELARAGVGDAGVRSFVCQNLSLQPDGTFRWRMNTAALLESLPGFAAFPPREALLGEDGPEPEMHFISGERSGYVRPQHHATVRAYFPNAVIHPPIAGAGHWVHADKPAEFWQLLASALKLEG